MFTLKHCTYLKHHKFSLENPIGSESIMWSMGNSSDGSSGKRVGSGKGQR